MALLACPLFAGQTRTWSQSEYSDFEKGIVKNLSLRSDGPISLAPRLRELFDTASPFLWALAQDSKGNLYAGGGTNAKLYRIPLDGKGGDGKGAEGRGKLLTEMDALEIHAIAVDSKDRVYFATSPDGKVYRLSGSGKPEVFYDPKAKYIWGLAFNSKGELFVATGDEGEIHRVAADGKGKLFFKCDEAHARSMAVDSADNVIVGTDPGGVVLRVSPAGEGFVLYQMPKKEVTAVAVGPDGMVYAAGVGVKQAGPVAPAPTGPAPPPPAPAITPGAAVVLARPTPPPSASLAPNGVPGGSEVYRIDPNAGPRRIWTHAQDVVYALAIDAAGRLVVGAGNRGSVYRIDSPTVYTALLTLPAAQVTGLLSGRDGHLYAVTGNVGKAYEIGPAVEHEGSLESDVFDAGMYSLWGRLSFEGSLNGGQIAITARSGNLDQPQKNWSAWSPAVTGPTGARLNSPASRFAQWRAVITAAGDAHSPELDSVDVAYLPKNVEPHIDQIEATPPNYKFPAPVAFAAAAPQQSLSLPVLGKRAPGGAAGVSVDSGVSPAMQYAKGYVGGRWLASDPNGDALMFTVEIRGANETEWKLLRDKLAERYYSWDSTAFPDGEYRLRITASDAPGNPPAEALTTQMVSDPFLIDNTPPKISGLTAARSGTRLQVKWHGADALNNIVKAEYSLDGGDWKVASPVTRLSDSLELDYDLTIDAAQGEHTIAVRVQDEFENLAADKVVVKN